jgi:cytochrome b
MILKRYYVIVANDLSMLLKIAHYFVLRDLVLNVWYGLFGLSFLRITSFNFSEARIQDYVE